MTRSPEPELAMVKRVAPFALPAAALALFLGAIAGGWGVGWSAAMGVAVVVANLAASAYSISRAARISLMALYVVAMVGFLVRLGVIVAIMFALNRLSWFSPLAFGLAVVPATLLILGYEMKLLAGGVGGELLVAPAGGHVPAGGGAGEKEPVAR